MIFLPIGNPADSFYGADRQGTTLYANCVAALDANTGKLRWYTRWSITTCFDYDISAPPALIEVKRDGKTIPAVAQITKMGLLFILDRMTGKPIFGVTPRAEERHARRGIMADAAVSSQAARSRAWSLTREVITNRTPEAHKFCIEWF
jgi:quinoprotein glucose dehydrogenase